MNRLIKKYIFAVSVILESPMCVTSGEANLTDRDILRDYDGVPFIPGSSLAGAIRAYLGDEEGYELFGGIETECRRGRQSSIWIMDCYFKPTLHTTIRDGVGLDCDKIAITGKKYDFEIIEKGVAGTFFMELVIREQDGEDKEKNMLHLIKMGLAGIDRGEIRFGSKKSRGFGVLKISKVLFKEFNESNGIEWASAYADAENAVSKSTGTHKTDAEDETGESTDVKSVNEENINGESGRGFKRFLYEDNGTILSSEKKYITIKVPLQQKGGMIIRRYGAVKGEADFVHLTSNRKPVIPGTSYAGVFRNRIREILEELRVSDVTGILRDMFGYVDTEKGKEKGGRRAKQSTVVFDESILQDGEDIKITRVGISRFESNGKRGALYTESSYFNGKTNLEIHIRRDKAQDWMIGLLLLVIDDLVSGYLTIGGQSGVGRGVFEKGEGNCLIDEKDITDKYYKAVYSKTMESIITDTPEEVEAQ